MLLRPAPSARSRSEQLSVYTGGHLSEDKDGLLQVDRSCDKRLFAWEEGNFVRAQERERQRETDRQGRKETDGGIHAAILRLSCSFPSAWGSRHALHRPDQASAPINSCLGTGTESVGGQDGDDG